MATRPFQSSLAALIEQQMGERGSGVPGPDSRPGSGPYLWAAVGQELRKAWSDLARSGATSEMEAAAHRLRERMMGEAAAGDPPFPARGASPAEDARDG